MIHAWLLRLAAARWRDDGRMLAEWRAEMSAVDSVFVLALADTLMALVVLSLWLAGGVASGMAVVRLTRRGRTAIAWAFIAVAAPALLLVPFGPLLVDFPYVLGYPDAGVGRIVSTLATSPFLHIALFGLVYLRGLAATKIPA